jgi:hypothetical protein
MRVPKISWRRFGRPEGRRRGPGKAMVWAVALGAGVLSGVQAVAADRKPVEKKSAAWLRFSMDSLGIPAFSNPFLSSGSSMLTVHFLDGSHLLVTYSLRTLVPRLRGDPRGDDDRLVAAEIVDLPSGHIAARTEWRMHDHGRYLWKLREGRFLVRMGDRLYTMAPMANLAANDPFMRTVFPSAAMRPNVVDVSPDGGVVTLETVLDSPEENQSTVVLLGNQDTAQEKSQTVINFYRMRDGDKGAADFEMEPAGMTLSPQPVYIPVDADGYLWAEPLDDAMWNLTFDSYDGKTVRLGTVLSSCRPRVQMISRSEFLVMSCRGSDDNIRVASYGLDGRETWEEGRGGYGPPTFAYAPRAARFAMSSTELDAPPPPEQPNAPPEAPRQEVRVYQDASGDLLLKVDCTPVFKTAENFDLSPDGMLAVVVRDGGIAVYKLPSLTKRDEADMAEVAKFAPPVTEANVSLARITKPATPEKIAAARAMAVEAPPAAAAAGGTVPPPAMVTVGKPSRLAAAAIAIQQASPESSQSGPRQAPTLLKPGEKPEYGSGNTDPE